MLDQLDIDWAEFFGWLMWASVPVAIIIAVAKVF